MTDLELNEIANSIGPDKYLNSFKAKKCIKELISYVEDLKEQIWYLKHETRD